VKLQQYSSLLLSFTKLAHPSPSTTHHSEYPSESETSQSLSWPAEPDNNFSCDIFLKRAVRHTSVDCIFQGPAGAPWRFKMAGDSETSKPADKGKGKAVEDPKKEKPLVNGKKDDEKIVDGRQCRIAGDGHHSARG
jgi:hypothetical protein